MRFKAGWLAFAARAARLAASGCGSKKSAATTDSAATTTTTVDRND